MPACSWQLQAPTHAHKLTPTSVPQMSDATPSSAGAVTGQISRQLSEALYRSVYHKGGHRLLAPDQPLDTARLAELQPASCPLTEEAIKFVRWEVSRCYDFKETSHINLQEVREVSGELKARVERCVTPSCGIHFADSMVTIGAWGHGRSSSYLLNGLLRKNIPWFVLVQTS